MEARISARAAALPHFFGAQRLDVQQVSAIPAHAWPFSNTTASSCPAMHLA